MIKLEHVVTASPEQMEFIIEGMRNPMNSWDKSDTCFSDIECYLCDDRAPGQCHCDITKYGGEGRLGTNDHALMMKLRNAGTDHRKYLRMMPVYVRITAPLYWWKEFDTYKVGTVANSCSTMHKIHAKPFSLSDFSIDNLEEESKDILLEMLDTMNYYRERYLVTKDKRYWWQMIQLLPSSYNQTRNVMLDYEVLANIYKSRKNHKLDEWKIFCKWIEELPYPELITGPCLDDIPICKEIMNEAERRVKEN